MTKEQAKFLRDKGQKHGLDVDYSPSPVMPGTYYVTVQKQGETQGVTIHDFDEAQRMLVVLIMAREGVSMSARASRR